MTFTYREDGYEEEFEAESWQEARTWAEDKAREGDYDKVTETIWVDVWVSDGEDEEGLTVDIDPEEPDCVGEGHDWQSPHSIVGGCESNPGVWGSGGGVIVKEVCLHCGCGKTTNTWAQNPSNGVQGLTSISYEEGEYSDYVPSPEVLEAYSRTDPSACDTARRAAAHIIAQIESLFGNTSCSDSELTEDQQTRVDEVVAFLQRVYYSVPYGTEKRAYRLALHLAAQDSGERVVARLISEALTPSYVAAAA